MARRLRKYIPYKVRLAAALVCLLPQEQRDDLRGRKVSPDQVLRLFTFDHLGLHALGGSDAWHNLDPKLRKPHQEKSRQDTSIVAKVKRLRAAPQVRAGKPKRVFVVETVPAGRAIPQRANPWPPKGTRKILTRRNFPAGHSTA